MVGVTEFELGGVIKAPGNEGKNICSYLHFNQTDDADVPLFEQFLNSGRLRDVINFDSQVRGNCEAGAVLVELGMKHALQGLSGRDYNTG